MDEVNSREQNGEESVLDHMIRERIAAFSAKRGRNVICYYSSWLQKPNRDDTGINDLDMNGFMNAVKDMDRSKGLDLVLHTPGGAVAATESVISYLHGCFGRDMVAFVPQLAMSGGTMMACAYTWDVSHRLARPTPSSAAPRQAESWRSFKRPWNR